MIIIIIIVIIILILLFRVLCYSFLAPRNGPFSSPEPPVSMAGLSKRTKPRRLSEQEALGT